VHPKQYSQNTKRIPPTLTLEAFRYGISSSVETILTKAAEWSSATKHVQKVKD